MRKALVFVFLFLFGTLLHAQQYSTENKRAIKSLQEGDELSARRMYDEAIAKYQSAVQKDASFTEAYLKWANLLVRKGDFDQALSVAQEADNNAAISSHNKAELAWLTSAILLRKGDFPEAIARFEGAREFYDAELKATQAFQRMEKKVAFIKVQLENPLLIEKEQLPVPLNEFFLQYFPVLTADSRQVLFTKRDGISPADHEDIYTSFWSGGQWTEPVGLSTNINTRYNEGTCTISADGNIMIFTSCDAPDSYGSCDLYITYKQNGHWQVPKNMGEMVNSRFWDSQPSLSADGSILFFSSNRKGGLGGNDIYYSLRQENGSWAVPVNVGEPINTPSNEVSPFMYFNNETLFFASDGHIGFGGLDIFRSTISRTTFGKPENLGSPINDHRDQLALFITAQRDYAYYTENTLKNDRLERSFIYRFPFPKEIELGERLVVTSGRVYNEKTGDPISASLSLVNLENDSTMYQFRSEGDSGRFVMIYPDKAVSGLYVEKQGFLPRIFNVEKDSLRDIENLKVSLRPLAQGEEFLFENVFFDFDQAILKPESTSSLVRLHKFLIDNPKVSIAVIGHTDNTGEQGYNEALSLRRAESVQDYLLNLGVEAKRISVKGMGASDPVMDNASAQGRARNRRIEIEILAL
ncbi:hypothetical protein GCM10007049_36040 [Echinicola pacifica]|uniref:OmpA-like domain-containing protein n=1 Tax=Echinicola pacifica TaxID=346377 RepID=A0A918QBY1_9BACT|nr:OmpA family protein [Echinicola pacifica]GGZ39539.1 hypothetical protein GCM10007049_36040 [Echinicola pacifica]